MLLFELLCKLFEYLQNHIEFVIQNFIASLSKYLKGTAQVFKRDEALPLKVAEHIVLQAGYTPKVLDGEDVYRQRRDRSVLKPRPPVVTVMGHVDHGKTTLLDSLRKTSVAAREAGGITQHIGAFSVPLANGHRITFLDTPGHAAFSAMRARGADVTDVVVLVVAADDGIMAQTVECIKLVNQAKVPVVVAVNKCDKYGADIAKLKRDLLHHGIQLEEFGGDVQAVEISGLKGTGLDALVEAVLAQAELCDCTADPHGPVEGVIIESRVDKGLGPVATVLIQHGTLRRGDVLVAKTTWGKIRMMQDEWKQPVQQATPSTPILTSGWKELPLAGSECLQGSEVEGEQKAQRVVDFRATMDQRKRNREAQARSSTPVAQARSGTPVAQVPPSDVPTMPCIPLVVQGDVAGSVEALLGVLKTHPPDQLELKIVHSGVGQITDSDVELAASLGAIILGFNVSCTKSTAALMKQREVTLIAHNVIYKLIELLKEKLETFLPLEWEEEIFGEAVLLKVFKLTGARRATVAGCRVKQGKLVRNATYRLLRQGKVIHEGPIIGMKQGTEDITTARKETECGVSFSVDPEFEVGDIIQCFTKKQTSQKLAWNLGF
eukprot:Em0019g1059a